MRNVIPTILAVLLLAGALVALQLSTDPDSPTSAPAASAVPERPADPESLPSSQRSTPAVLPSPTADTANRAGAGEPAVDARAAIWSVAGDVPESRLPRRNKQIEDQHLVAMDRRRLMALSPGDAVPVWIPDLDEDVTVHIERVEELASGNRSIRGAVDGIEPFSFVMTVGETAVFATIGTRVGVYNLRGNTDHAWLVSSRALRELVDPEKPDYRIPNA